MIFCTLTTTFCGCCVIASGLFWSLLNPSIRDSTIMTQNNRTTVNSVSLMMYEIGNANIKKKIVHIKLFIKDFRGLRTRS